MTSTEQPELVENGGYLYCPPEREPEEFWNELDEIHKKIANKVAEKQILFSHCINSNRDQEPPIIKPTRSEMAKTAKESNHLIKGAIRITPSGSGIMYTGYGGNSFSFEEDGWETIRVGLTVKHFLISQGVAIDWSEDPRQQIRLV